MRVQLLPVWLTIPVPPLSSYFLSSPPCLSLSLINVKLSNNKASILPLPSSSVPCICHCDPPPLPTQWPPSSFHMAAELKTQAHSANMKGCSAKGREKVKGKHFSHFFPFFLPFPALINLGTERDAVVVCIIHGEKIGLHRSQNKFL